MSDYIDPFADEQEDRPVAPENNDEQTRHQVAALLNRLQRIRRYRDWETDRKSTRLNSSHITRSRMPSSA